MTKSKKLLQQIVNGLLIAIVLGLLGWLSLHYKIEADWTANHRNTLTVGSQKLLKSLPDPIKFVDFDYANSETRTDVQQWVDRYHRFKKDVSVEFVDPSREPGKVKEYNVQQPGELVLEYQGRREHLSSLSEITITGALQRMTDSGEHFIVFLEGHGERALSGDGKDTAFDQFVAALQDKGLKAEPLNLVKTPKIPDNASALVIASPTQKLLDGEIKIIKDWVAAGGNLLWLTDPDQPTGLEALAKALNVTWLNGFAVFPDYQSLGTGSPGVYVATDYPPNPVTQGFTDITAYPLARALDWDKDAAKAAGWNVQPLLTTNENAWLETGKMEGAVKFDEKDGDKPGPLTIGLTMTREIKASATESKAVDAAGKDAAAAKPAGTDAAADADKGAQPRTQRVVLIGDSDFISDANLPALGNKQLGLNILQWLASRDAQLNIDVPKAPDAQLFLPGWATWLIGLGYTLFLPALLLGYGITRWLVRRRK
ncbi:MAG: hypothetical protein JWR16_2167 [Nevskia sp.]|nr:hypothetical protein [Nevskia sp.]